eukprot:Plantae.Rhodophyta-Hildenbrandia_rubra.ctg5518.p2 GENE.Plantae.Rhodophyta-Hildenbrandia_rubra.ctg5518~~Plantae.Rhodophyta-Hildenbrandia_rubra.ctg5518.p2  ORF type:complete len:458 (-),score=118.18 Plantae.Rhodophyta-Hildenbrandia_rubra.ctg5518:3954-5327(-)
MEPTSTTRNNEAHGPSTTEVRVRYAHRDLEVTAPSSWTILDLRLHMETLTDVPPDKQRYLWRSYRGRGNQVGDEMFVKDVVKDGKPIMMLVKQEVREDKVEIEESEVGSCCAVDGRSEVDGDLPELLIDSSSEGEGRAGFAMEVEEVREDRQRAFAAPMSLEEIGEALKDAVVGSQYATEVGEGSLRYLRVDSFADALREAKRKVKMLVALITNVGNEAFDVEKEVGDGEIVEYFNENMVVFPVDLGRLGDQGPKFLERLGLHGTPSMVIFAQSNEGMMVVDLFATDFVVGTTGLLPRMMNLAETYDAFYQAARFRKEVSSQRTQQIAEQDEEFQRGLREDKKADDEKRKREEEERQRQADITNATRRLDQTEEGDVAVRITVSDSGTRIERTFKGDEPVSVLFDLCVARGVEKDGFVLNSRFPRKSISLESDGTKSLESVLETKQALLFVELVSSR